MPLYRFHVINDIDAPDMEGLDLPSLSDANLHAIDAARDLAAHAVKQGRLDLKHRIDIEDADGKQLLTVTFKDAIAVTG
jgi:hypothetical protein